MSHVFITRRATPRVAAQSKVLPASWRLLEWSGSERRVVCTLLDTKSIRLSSAISHEQRLAEGSPWSPAQVGFMSCTTRPRLTPASAKGCKRGLPSIVLMAEMSPTSSGRESIPHACGKYPKKTLEPAPTFRSLILRPPGMSLP